MATKKKTTKTTQKPKVAKARKPTLTQRVNNICFDVAEHEFVLGELLEQYDKLERKMRFSLMDAAALGVLIGTAVVLIAGVFV